MNTARTFARKAAGRLLRPLVDRWEAARLYRATIGEVARLRRYTLDECDLDAARGLRGTRQRPLVLGVVGGYPFLGYVRLGYDWKGPYYNPNLLFDQVHYFQNKPTRPLVLDLGYPLHVHSFRSAADVARISRAAGVNVLRAYDTYNGKIAIEAAGQLGVPVLVSIH